MDRLGDNIQIRPLERTDIPALLGLMRDQAAFEKMSDVMVATESDYEVAFFGDRPYAEAICAVEAGTSDPRLLGVAVFFSNFSTFTGKRGLYLEDIHVTETARGQGIGTKLLRHLAALAKHRGCARFEWVVLDWNQKAIDFYQALGAELLPDWRIVRAEDNQIAAIAVSRDQD